MSGLLWGGSARTTSASCSDFSPPAAGSMEISPAPNTPQQSVTSNNTVTGSSSQALNLDSTKREIPLTCCIMVTHVLCDLLSAYCLFHITVSCRLKRQRRSRLPLVLHPSLEDVARLLNAQHLRLQLEVDASARGPNRPGESSLRRSHTRRS